MGIEIDRYTSIVGNVPNNVVQFYVYVFMSIEFAHFSRHMLDCYNEVAVLCEL